MGDRKGRGWYDFAGVLFALAGVWNSISGLSAIFKKEYFSEAGLIYQNLQVWGWVWLVLGIVQLGTAAALIGGGGRIVAIVLAAISATVSFASIGAYPLWSILVIAIDVLMIYGLTTHPESGTGEAFPGSVTARGDEMTPRANM
jgi:hypothetical protein